MNKSYTYHFFIVKKLIYTFFCALILHLGIANRGFAYQLANHTDTLKIVSTVALPKHTAASIDRHGYVYIADKQGTIHLYNEKGKEVQSYAPTRSAKASYIMAWNPMRVWVFYQAFQEFVLLNRSLIEIDNYNLKNFHDNFVRKVSPSADNNLWMLDETDFSLKKINILNAQTILHTPLDMLAGSGYFRVYAIREWQNLLFVGVEDKGVWVFDNLGNLSHTLDIPKLEQLSFVNNYLIHYQDHCIILQDLYKKTSETYSLPVTVPTMPDYVLSADAESFALVYKKTLIFVRK
ncbi:MAG: hypothetical protein JJT94_03865 [Bernardetiaceae bacterium]|nr:hypothetical protein [Bernardetiaceae bacterium]